MARQDFFSAAQKHQSAHGYVLANDKGAYFCGFLQEDGTLASSYFTQSLEAEGPSFNQAESDAPFAKDTPVFLKASEMGRCNLSAIAYPTREIAAHSSGLSYDERKNCRILKVAKDVAVEKPDQKPREIPTGFDAYDLLAPIEFPAAGLSSPEACEKGIDKGFASIRTAAKNFLTHKLGL